MAYDKEGDIFDISLGEPREAISTEIENDLFIRTNPDTNEVVGISILNFEKWFEDIKDFRTLPIVGTFEIPAKAA
ncbi:MAG: hypothetical protein BA872_09565 [Desulfobacterales bacterium C00003060]|nr:MAG: hypothetical protein BA861_07240 [Desulfobacterales bacterium S3730MH5]OEU81449.1 MAG: hypothetical protein BA872_09565 [Desulfobacterales bacterium C00003060]